MTSISFVGDLRLLNPQKVELSSDLNSILNGCEYNIINFEAPIKEPKSCAIEKSGPSLHQNSQAPDWIERNGWNIVSLANNHILDYGYDSLDYTIKSFNNSLVIGVGTRDEAYRIRTVQTEGGLKIGIIACAHHEFGALCENNQRKGYAWIGNTELTKEILKSRKEVDFLILYAHAGVENFSQPLPEWRDSYRFFIDIGCDAVIASHPHIIQGWEEYKGKPIFYSLGNFCFQKEGISVSRFWNYSLVCVLHFEQNRRISYEAYPLYYDEIDGIIQITSNKEICSYIDDVNRVLNDENLYLKFVNEELPKLWGEYLHLFSNSGFINNFLSRNFLSIVKRKLLRKNISYTHLLNNFQNESHRWAIERILRCKNNLIY